MKPLWIAGLVIVVVLVGGGWYASNLASEKEAMMQEEKMIEKDAMVKGESDDAMVDTKDEGAMMEKEQGSYEAYGAEKLARAETGDVVLFFRASWCPTCRALDADIKSNLGSIPAGVTILDVDYDNSTALKQKYGVTYQHTLVQVDATGTQIAKWSKSPTLASLLANIK